jgi:hypothetical protein
MKKLNTFLTMDNYRRSFAFIKPSSLALDKAPYRLFTLASLHNRISASFHTSTIASLNPWFITGFSDAESSFMISITKRERNQTG